MSKSQRNSMVLGQDDAYSHARESKKNQQNYNRICDGAHEPVSPNRSRNNMVFNDMTRTELARMMHISMSRHSKTPPRQKNGKKGDSPETIYPQELKGVLKNRSRSRTRGSDGAGPYAMIANSGAGACDFQIPRNQIYVQNHDNFKDTQSVISGRPQMGGYLQAYQSKYGSGAASQKRGYY